MCNEACAASPSHKPECQMTLARGHPMSIDIGNSSKPFPLYETVAIMRCLYLKNTAPEKYKALMALEPHTEERKRNGRYVDYPYTNNPGCSKDLHHGNNVFDRE